MKKAKKSRPGSAIPVSLYYEMCKAYMEFQSSRGVAKACSVREATARKYILKGDPRRGLPAIKDWLMSVRESFDRSQKEEVAEYMKKAIKLNDGYLQQILRKIAQLQSLPVEKVPNEIARAGEIDKSIRLGAFLRGNPDQHIFIDSNITPADIAVLAGAKEMMTSMTTEELEVYVLSGKYPDRILSDKKSIPSETTTKKDAGEK
jgi:hypothetical protein